MGYYAHKDIQTIAARGMDNPEGFANVGTFVLATIRVQFSRVADDIASIREGKTAPLWGCKAETFRYIQENKAELYTAVKTARNEAQVLDTLTTIPGFGLVKAGFWAQCLGWDVGCIDTHNAKLYNITAGELSLNKQCTAKTKLAKIDSYITLCDGLGGSEALWETWCELMAAKYPKHWSNGAEVSALHVELTR